MEYVTEHVIDNNSVKWKSSVLINAFHIFSSFKPFLRFLILPSTNSYSYIFLLSVWHFLLVIENIKHINLSHLSHWADPWIIAAITKKTTPKNRQPPKKTQKDKQAKKPKYPNKQTNPNTDYLLNNSVVKFNESKWNDISTH